MRAIRFGLVVLMAGYINWIIALLLFVCFYTPKWVWSVKVW